MPQLHAARGDTLISRGCKSCTEHEMVYIFAEVALARGRVSASGASPAAAAKQLMPAPQLGPRRSTTEDVYFSLAIRCLSAYMGMLVICSKRICSNLFELFTLGCV